MKTRKLLFCVTLYGLTAVLISGCKKDKATNSNSFNQSPKTDKTGLQTSPPQAYLPGTGEPVTFNMKDGSVITLQKVNGEYVLGGDMILSQNQLQLIKDNSTPNKLSIQSIVKRGNNLQTSSTFTSNFNILWPNGIVYYALNDPINQTTILATISYYQSVTGIRFVKRTTQANYVEFDPSPVSGAAGDSQIGMVGGKQMIRLTDNVDEGSVIHEIGHTLGLLHEQTRGDRDIYINVNYSNINSSWTAQYNIYTGSSGFEIGPFDYQSVMIYSSYYPQVGYPGNSAPQMTKKSDGSIWYQGSSLSAGDISGINYLYFNHLFARMRYVVSYDGSTSDETYVTQDVYLDFFSDATGHTPKVLVNKVLFNDLNSEQIYQNTAYDNPYYINSLNSINLPAGASSYYIGSVTTDLIFTYDGVTEPGSYSNTIQPLGGLGYVVIY